MIYSLLAPIYDEINKDIDYGKWADFIEEIIEQVVIKKHLGGEEVTPGLLLETQTGDILLLGSALYMTLGVAGTADAHIVLAADIGHQLVGMGKGPLLAGRGGIGDVAAQRKHGVNCDDHHRNDGLDLDQSGQILQYFRHNFPP